MANVIPQFDWSSQIVDNGFVIELDETKRRVNDTDRGELLGIIESLLAHADVQKFGPGGVNLSCVRRGYDALAAGLKSGDVTHITASVARDMQCHGWDIGYHEQQTRTNKQ